MRNDVLASAIGLGLPVFPCLANKAPACAGGFKSATADPAAIRGVWRKSPGPLIGVPTGAVSGFDVLDIDPKSGGGEWFSHNRARLPETRVHRTAAAACTSCSSICRA